MLRQTGMPNITRPAKVTKEQRRALEALGRRRSAKAGLVRRVRVILLSAEGTSGAEIARRVGLSQEPRFPDSRGR